MPPSLGEAVLELTADHEQLKRDIEKAGAGARAALDKLSKGLTTIGKGMTAGITLPLVGIGAFAISAASDLDESINKINVVFGESAAEILGWSADAATAFGLTQQKALEAVGTYGNLFTAMGIGGEASMEMSQNLVQLAADLASFNNIDPTVALDKLRAGLSGETEPLKTLGVNLNQAAIEAKAMELGLIAVGDVLTPAAKAQASYALIMEQTTNAQGDFARTSDGLANSMRIAKAEVGDLAAELGTELLPLATDLIRILRDLFERFKELSPEQKKTIVVVAGLAAAVGPLLLVLGSLISSVSSVIGVVTAAAPVLGAIAAVITGPVGLAIVGLVALVAGLYFAWKTNFLGIQVAFEYWKGVILQIFAAFSLAFEGDWRGFGEALREIWDNHWAMIKELAIKAWDIIKNIDWGELGKSIIQGLAKGITSGTHFIKEAALNAVLAAVDVVKGFLGLDSPSKLFMGFGRQATAGFALGMRDTRPLEGALQNLANVVHRSALGYSPFQMAAATTNNYNLAINTSAPYEPIIDDFRFMESSFR